MPGIDSELPLLDSRLESGFRISLDPAAAPTVAVPRHYVGAGSILRYPQRRAMCAWNVPLFEATCERADQMEE